MKMDQVSFTLLISKIGSIGIQELEKPLISLGLCNTREEVKRIMDDVDEDGSGQMEFKEFLQIIKRAQHAKRRKRSSMASPLPAKVSLPLLFNRTSE
jgi:Ca2+-binding EF-hand superfamily protein